MRTSKPTLAKFGKHVVLGSLFLLAWMLPGAGTAYANGTPKPPPPPPPPPATSTNTPQPTDTPEPTNTPEPTSTPEPTDTEEPTATTEPPQQPPPTNTPMPTNTTAPGQPPPVPEQPEGSGTNSDCRSSVQGTVTDNSGNEASGATVLIEGEGWSDGILSDDSGHYGFGGLCPGAATLNAYLSNGQVSQPAQVLLNGRDSMEVNLSAAPMQATVAATTAMVQQTATPVPDLPATGYSGWLLAGAALLGLVLFLSAGTRRALGERTQDHD